MEPCNQAKHVEIFQCKQHDEVHRHSPKFLLSRHWGIVCGPFDELRSLLRIWWQIEDLLRIFWGPIEDLRIFNGIAHPYLLNASIIIRIYLKPLLLFENQQSILHLYWKQTLFSFWISSKSVCVVHQQAHYSTRFPNQAFSLCRLSFVRVPCLPFPGCLWVPTHPGPSAFHHHTRVFPPSFRCLCSRYRVALISRRKHCTVPAQLMVYHTHQVACAVDFTDLYICDMILQNHSSVAGVYQSPCVYPSFHLLSTSWYEMFTCQRG